MTYYQLELMFKTIQNNEQIFKITINGWPLWSVIKSQLFIRCAFRFTSKKKETFLSKIIKMKKLILKQFFRYFIALFKWYIYQISKSESKDKIRVLFLFFSEHRFKNAEGKMENFFGESIIKAKGRKFDVFIIERTKGYQKFKNTPYKVDLPEDIISFPGYMGFSLQFKMNKLINERLTDLETILIKQLPEDVNSHFISILIEELHSKLILRSIFNFLRDKHKASILLSKIDPKVVILTASSGYLGTIAAAKELGIPVIEIQHGVAKENYVVYQWPEFLKDQKKKLPIPDTLFLWGPYWVDQQKRTKFWNHEEVFAYGNTKISLLKKDFWLKRESMGGVKLKESKFEILFTTNDLFREQAIEFIDDLLHLIKINRLNYFINIKLHPNEDFAYGYYHSKLFMKYPHHCKIFNHNEKPLYEHFLTTRVHLTVFSAALFESMELEIPTIVFTKEGCDYYSDIIADGELKYAQNADECLDMIKNVEKGSILNNESLMKTTKPKNYYFVEPDIEKFANYINVLADIS